MEANQEKADLTKQLEKFSGEAMQLASEQRIKVNELLLALIFKSKSQPNPNFNQIQTSTKSKTKKKLITKLLS